MEISLGISLVEEANFWEINSVSAGKAAGHSVLLDLRLPGVALAS